MNDRGTARYNMFGRVTTSGTDHAADFAPGSNAPTHFTALAGIIADLDEDLSLHGIAKGDYGQRLATRGG